MPLLKAFSNSKVASLEESPKIQKKNNAKELQFAFPACMSTPMANFLLHVRFLLLVSSIFLTTGSVVPVETELCTGQRSMEYRSQKQAQILGLIAQARATVLLP